MRILLEFSNLGYLNYHFFCESLKKKIRNVDFIATRSTNSFILEFLKNQKEVDYIFTEIEPKFDSNKFKIDHEYLNFFEKQILKCSIWKVIASDRSLGKAYESGVRNQDFDSKFKNDRNYLLKYFAYRVQCIKKKFEYYKPDYFIPAVAMGSIDTMIYSQFAKFYKVKYAVLNWLRIENYCSFAYDYHLNVKFFEKELKDSVEKNFDKKMSSEVEKLYAKIVNKTKTKNLSKNENSKLDIFLNYFENSKLFFKIFGWPILICKAIYVSLKNNVYHLINRKRNVNSSAKKVNIFNISYWIYKEFIAKITFYKEVFRSKKTGLNYLPVNENYIYFPLQVQPEYSTNVQATMWMNNINIIESLSKSIPHDWYIYVKDHPAMVMDRVRSKNFYLNITKYPNVRLLNINIDSNKIILNSKAVLSTSGTTAFDGILLSKPVIETRTNVWSNIKLSKICTDVESLYDDICEETERVSKISQEERDQLIKHYFDVVLKFGFKQENVKEAFYNRNGKEEDYKKCGYSMAEGFLKYLNYLKEV
jgi:hypothetical protein